MQVAPTGFLIGKSPAHVSIHILYMFLSMFSMFVSYKFLVFFISVFSATHSATRREKRKLPSPPLVRAADEALETPPDRRLACHVLPRRQEEGTALLFSKATVLTSTRAQI
jgi:hypothetical protein